MSHHPFLYSKVRVLGKGSFGKVYLVTRRPRHAKHLHDAQTCVLKQIRLTSITTVADEKRRQQVLQQFQNECRVMERIRHPHIVQYIESYIDGTSLNIVMEYASGGDLECMLARRAGRLLEESTVWRNTAQVAPFLQNLAHRHCANYQALGLQLVQGLHYLHTRSIIHRDLKPSNVFLDQHGNLKIGDLGMGKQMLARQQLTSTVQGTPLYFSPEVCNEQPYNELSDIWALGCLVYEMCALRPPFVAVNIVALCKKITTTTPAPLPRVFSDRLAHLVRDMLCKRSDLRPTVEQLLARVSGQRQEQPAKRQPDESFVNMTDTSPLVEQGDAETLSQLLDLTLTIDELRGAQDDCASDDASEPWRPPLPGEWTPKSSVSGWRTSSSLPQSSLFYQHKKATLPVSTASASSSLPPMTELGKSSAFTHNEEQLSSSTMLRQLLLLTPTPASRSPPPTPSSQETEGSLVIRQTKLDLAVARLFQSALAPSREAVDAVNRKQKMRRRVLVVLLATLQRHRQQACEPGGRAPRDPTAALCKRLVRCSPVCLLGATRRTRADVIDRLVRTSNLLLDMRSRPQEALTPMRTKHSNERRYVATPRQLLTPVSPSISQWTPNNTRGRKVKPGLFGPSPLPQLVPATPSPRSRTAQSPQILQQQATPDTPCPRPAARHTRAHKTR